MNSAGLGVVGVDAAYFGCGQIDLIWFLGGEKGVYRLLTG